MATQTAKLRPHGYTIVEMLMVGALIALLMGLVVGGAAKLKQNAMREQTRATLAGAMAALTEYQARTGRVVDHTQSKDNSRIRYFVEKANQIDDVDKILRSLGKAVYDRDNMTIKDAWGNEIDYLSFVDHDDRFGGDDIHPEFNQPFFASRGLDGAWGEANDRQAKDNIYSVEALPQTQPGS